MSDPNYSDLSGPLHHYPPTGAEWVTSPLSREDDGLNTHPQPTVTPLLRLGAMATLGGGLLAIASSLLQHDLVSYPAIWFLWLVVLAILVAMGTVLGSISLLHRVTSRRTRQLIPFALVCVAAQLVESAAFAVTAGSAHVPGIWVAVGDTFLLLVGGCILRFIGQPSLSSQEWVEQVDEERRTWDYSRGDKFIGGWRKNWNPPQTGN
jgi:hypothetical protein